METINWQTLYARAVASCQPRDVSNSVYAGSVAAALVTSRGTVFTGVSVDTACSLGFCAERNALGSMLTAGEQTVTRIVAVRGREILMPCGACREFLRQLGNPDVEVLVQLAPLVSVKLKELLPRYWQA
ncbi:cytidine deaminase family protein [Lactiplantibacillus plajomi]|uniref:Cytidine deaminase n=1 Tax=Lactiplantibacillus plajomi TaxID=1457217 RepID=A0ABV6K1S4_9LACO|nr:cytidine deaminase [Lactiplantibacillus plajomi]